MVMKQIFRYEQGRVSYLIISIGILIILFITLLFVIFRLRSPAGKGFVNLPPPTEVIWYMYESSLRGDIDSYLNCFAPESQLAIQDTLKGMGKEAFREYLRNKAIGIMGVSIYSADRETQETRGANNLKNQAEAKNAWQSGEDVMNLPVEIVFRGRNEVQVFNLKRIGNEWKILTASSPTLTPQPIPYGHNVNE